MNVIGRDASFAQRTRPVPPRLWGSNDVIISAQRRGQKPAPTNRMVGNPWRGGFAGREARRGRGWSWLQGRFELVRCGTECFGPPKGRPRWFLGGSATWTG